MVIYYNNNFIYLFFFLCLRSKVNTLLVDYAMNGFTVHHCPISEEQMPSVLECIQLIDKIHTSLQNGRKILIQ